MYLVLLMLALYIVVDIPCIERRSSDMLSAMEDANSSPSLPFLPVKIVSKSSVFPDQPSTLGRLNLSVFDVRLLFFHYFQLGLLFPRPIHLPSTDLLNHLKSSLSRALSLYPPLAGCLSTDPDDGSYFIASNDAGADFVHAVAPGLSIADVAGYDSDVPDVTNALFHLNGVTSLEGCSITGVQVTELADGVFVSCSINHAVVDGTSFMNFMNSWSELCRGIENISQPPDFTRHLLNEYPPIVPRPPVGSTDPSPAIRDRVFHFSREAIQCLKAKANVSMACIEGGMSISSFQSLCAQVWRSVTRARMPLSPGMETSLWLAANCRNRMEPPLSTHYFGNAIMTVNTVAKVEEVVGREVGWCAQQLHRNVAALGVEAVRREMEIWKEQKDPRATDGPFLLVAWSPSFPIYRYDMGWGRPAAAFSGTAQKCDGLVLALPGIDGGGSVDLEVCLAPETMARLESDGEFMQYVAAGIHSKKGA